MYPVYWRQIKRTNFTSLQLLANYLELSPENQNRLHTAPCFTLNLPKRLATKIKKNDLSDPILRQFVPLIEETNPAPGFTQDPVGDLKVQCTPKLLHKYEGRALLVSTSACAMHCRYCFRKEYPYETENKSFEQELEAVRNDPSIHELILSGGDPLSLSNEKLAELLEQISAIPHIQRLRIHSRFLIGIPERLDEELLSLLASFPLQIWFVVHINHVAELDADVLAALKKIQKLGIPVLNQAVLLKGVNDSEEALEALFGQLANRGIFAYYLHQLDKVQGSSHFEISVKRGLELIAHLERTLPGYAVPKYVEEVSGRSSKTIIK